MCGLSFHDLQQVWPEFEPLVAELIYATLRCLYHRQHATYLTYSCRDSRVLPVPIYEALQWPQENAQSNMVTRG